MLPDPCPTAPGPEDGPVGPAASRSAGWSPPQRRASCPSHSPLHDAPPTTWGELQDAAEGVLRAAGHDAAEAEARTLLSHVTGLAPTRLPLMRREPAAPAQAARLQALAARRAAGEPLQYVTGETYFLGLRLRCTPAALIPRPETEELAVRVIEALRRRPAAAALLADIGTGSGALAVVLAHHLPGSCVAATDVSHEALALAQENAALRGLQEQVRLLHGPYLQPLREAGLANELTALVCNPPYVSACEWDSLPPDVREHEPREALLGLDDDGAGFYRRLLPEVAAHAPSLQLIAFEVGYRQAPTVAALLRDALPRLLVTVHRDLAGIERVVMGEAPPDA